MKTISCISWKSVVNISFLLVFCGCESPATGVPGPLEKFTGTHTRVVWVQEQSSGTDVFAFGANFKLMGYDSRDGNNERELLAETGNFYKPILTSDGKQVVVSSRSKHEIYLVDFRKGKKKSLGKGVAVDVWDDPVTGKKWIYALAGEGRENKYLSTNPLIRFPLNEPKERELVWDKTHLSWSNFDLSRDGKFAGGLFPWPHAGILQFEKDTWKKYGKGCWTALSPDNSAILWIFDGLHRNLNFINPFTTQSWTTNINNAPGIGGFEVYHPRWSNHVRYLTMTGPYVEGKGGNKIGGGGKKVEIYVGKFSPDLKSVEGWFQVTHNTLADFYPDVWLANGSESTFLESQANVQQIPTADQSMDWPGNREQLVFLWNNVLTENKLGDDSLLGFQQIRVIPNRRARFNRFLEMNFNQSGFVADWSANDALSIMKKKGGLGIELLFTPAATAQQDVGAILTLQNKESKPYLRLSQKANDLELTIFAQDNLVKQIKLSEFLHEHRPEHIFVSLQGNHLKVYGNGRLVKEVSLAVDPLSLWTDGGLQFGHVEATTLGINGTLSHVAIYAAAPTAQEISKKSQLVTGALEARSNVEAIAFQGELVEVSKVPAPDSLGAYTRALVVNRYKIRDSLQGDYPEKEILVAQWAVLDRKILPETKKFSVGQFAKMRVEKFDDHPELEGERLMMDMFDPDLEIYYQVEL